MTILLWISWKLLKQRVTHTLLLTLRMRLVVVRVEQFVITRILRPPRKHISQGLPLEMVKTQSIMLSKNVINVENSDISGDTITRGPVRNERIGMSMVKVNASRREKELMMTVVIDDRTSVEIGRKVSREEKKPARRAKRGESVPQTKPRKRIYFVLTWQL